jgi:hypothetical protein
MTSIEICGVLPNLPPCGRIFKQGWIWMIFGTTSAARGISENHQTGAM